MREGGREGGQLLGLPVSAVNRIYMSVPVLVCQKGWPLVSVLNIAWLVGNCD